jgi:glycerophosphoryl diester phosphodiesterase
MSYNLLRYFIYSTILLLLLSGAAIAVIHILFQKKREIINKYPTVWSHRGINNSGLEENSIKAFEHVLKKGLKGIEIDVFWDEKSERLLVTHDQPKQNTNYKDLGVFISRFKDSTSYWIDLKNLTCNNQSAIEKAITAMLSAQNKSINIFIESQNGWALRNFDSPGIKTIFWAQFNRSGLKRIAKLIYLKSIIAVSSFNGISCSYKLYDKDFMNNFDGFSIFLFHLNNEQIKQIILKRSSVHVLLADGDYLSSKK